MKLVKTVRLTGALLAGVVLSAYFGTANAAPIGTPTGTSITNIALASYSVNGTAQNSICSSPTGNTTSTGSTSSTLSACTGGGGAAGTNTSFVVDTKLLLSVVAADTADVGVAPGSSGGYLTYTVTNLGNSTQGVILNAVNDATGTANPFTGNTDSFDAPAFGVFIEKGVTTGYQVAEDTQTGANGVSQLASGASVTVYVVTSGTFSITAVDGTVAVLGLRAQEAATGTAGYTNPAGTAITTDDAANAWTPGTAQKLFADGSSVTVADADAAKDGIASGHDAFVISTAKLTITKAVSILSDPTGDAIKHAIPGAVVQYTITVANANTATSAATGIGLSDALPTNTTWNSNSLQITTPGVNSGAQFGCLDTGTTMSTVTSPYTAVTCGFASSTVSVSGIYLKPNDTASIVYTVTIN